MAHPGPPDASVADVASWLGQFSRVLRTCRLYDGHNRTAVKFRAELGTALGPCSPPAGRCGWSAPRTRFTATGTR